MSSQNRDYYLGNSNLPTPRATFDYGSHPEWVADIEKCKKNILHFAENFFFIVNVDEGRQKIKLHSYQKRLLRAFRDNRWNLVLSSRQSGKALDLNTPILTTKGWKTMGSIEVGDFVYDIKGKKTKVIGAWETLNDRNCYEVEFDNGEKIIADEDHLWFTQTRYDRNQNISGAVRNTKQILETLTAGKKRKEPNHRIPMSIEGVEGCEQNLPISPYILGLWLGDGTSATGVITVGKRDITEILDILNNHEKQFDKIIVHEYKKDVYSVNITNSKNSWVGLCGLLRQNNILNNKHIPEIYLQSSRKQRLDLLQGLIDSDGYIDAKGNACFYNTNLNLALQVKELIQSLGYKTYYKTYTPKLQGVECAETAIVSFKPIEYVCRLSFKRNRVKLKTFTNQSHLRSHFHYIKNITPVVSRPVRCITVDNREGIYLAGKQLIPTHNTTVFTIFVLWRACFVEDQRILIVANKEETAIHILSRIKLAFENLPNYLKPGTVEWGKTSVAFGNGSSIAISTTSSDTGRGQSCSLLCIDEMAFIDNSILEDFWRSVYPIISSSKTAKILVASTPNGANGLFYTLYDGAQKNENGWHLERVDWWDVPGRDEKWKDQTIKTMANREAFAQEYENVFHASGEASIDVAYCEKLQKLCKEPLHKLEDGDYLIWKMPDPAHIYAVGVDISEGVGAAATVMQVLDITDLKNIEQVACYTSNKITPIKFIPKLHEFLQHWGKPPVLIERNNCGAQVVDQLYEVYRYENIVTYGIKGFNRIGVQAHTNTKYKGVTNERYWLNDVKHVVLNDVQTVKELFTFQRQPNGTWCAKSGAQDDRVMALIWALMILEIEICEKYFEIIQKDTNNKPSLLKLADYGSSRTFQDIEKQLKSNRDDDVDVLPCFVRPNVGQVNSDLMELEELGWKFM